MPAAACKILEHDGEAAVGQHQLGVGAAHRRVGPPALLDDPALAHLLDRAVEAGARELSGPKQKPWGQTVSYVRDPNGVLIELCSPMA